MYVDTNLADLSGVHTHSRYGVLVIVFSTLCLDLCSLAWHPAMCMNDCNKYYVLAFDIRDIRVQTFVVYEQYRWVNRASETLKKGYFVTIYYNCLP